MKRRASHKIDTLDAKHRQLLVALFCAAFEEYPLFRILFDESGDDYDRHLRDLMQFWVDIYIGNQLGLHGCFRKDKLAGAALVSPPGGGVYPNTLENLIERVVQQLGVDTFSKLEEFERRTEAALPTDTHHFLGILASDPQFQRQGVGRTLIEHVKRVARKSGGSSGICLTTEAVENVKYYELQGFRTISHVDVFGLQSWGMCWEA